MPLPKVWVDYDRLDAADLNADMAYLDAQGAANAARLAKLPVDMVLGASTITMAGATGIKAITFAKAFVAAPAVFIVGSDNAAPKISFRAASPSTTGFSVTCGTGDATTSAATLAFSWLAIGQLVP